MNDSNSIRRLISISFIGNATQQIVQILSIMVTARYLVPADFGVIGLTTVFTAISTVLVDAGYSTALLREKEFNESKYSQVFVFNVLMAMLLYSILIALSGQISLYFNEPRFEKISLLVFLLIPINAISSIHLIMLNKKMQFKRIAFINNVSGLFIAFSSIVLAMNGFGIYSLAIGPVAGAIVKTVLLWIFNQWLPMIQFNRFEYLKKQFSFSSKLLLTSIVNHVSNNFIQLLLGKYYSVSSVGFYTQASKLQSIPMASLTSAIHDVYFQHIVKIGNPNDQDRATVKVIEKVTIGFSIVFSLFSLFSYEIVTVIFSDKWIRVAPIFSILCFNAVLYPLVVLVNMSLKIKGQSSVIFKMELIKSSLVVVVLFVFRDKGILFLLYGFLITNLIYYLVLVKKTWNNRLLIKKIYGVFGVSAFVIACSFFVIHQLGLNHGATLLESIMRFFVFSGFVFAAYIIFKFLKMKELKND